MDPAAPASEVAPFPPPRRHRWTLPVALAVLAVWLLGIALLVEDARRALRARTYLRMHGASMGHDVNLQGFWSHVGLGPTVVDSDLKALQSLPGVVELDLRWAHRITDDGTAILRDLPELRVLRLGSGGRPHVWYDSDFSDAALAHLRSLRHLEELDLAFGDFTDAGLIHLRGLRKLRELNLEGTSITDASLDVIAGLPRLRTVSLRSTSVSPEGVASLQARRPDLEIEGKPLEDETPMTKTATP